MSENPDEIGKFNNLPDSFYKTLIDSLDTGVYLVDLDRRVVYWNQSAERLSGYSADDIIGHFCGDGFLQHVNFEGRILCGDGCPLKATIQDGEPRETDVLLKHKDGHRVPVRVRANPIYDRGGEIIGAVESFNDVTPELDARQRIKQLAEEANTDALTGIINRRMAERLLKDELVKWERFQRVFGILFVDMNDLKEINDSFGHNAGDAAIKIVARTLRNLFRTEDVVARWGGDEFIVLMNNVDQAILKKLVKKAFIGVGAAELPAEYGGRRVSVSVGGTLVQKGDTSDSIIARADQKMYASKRQNKFQ